MTNRQKANIVFRVSLVLTALMYAYLYALSFVTMIPSQQTLYITSLETSDLSISISSWWDPLIFFVLVNVLFKPACVIASFTSEWRDPWYERSAKEGIRVGIVDSLMIFIVTSTFGCVFSFVTSFGLVTGLSIGTSIAAFIGGARLALLALELLANFIIRTVNWRWFLAEDKQ